MSQNLMKLKESVIIKWVVIETIDVCDITMLCLRRGHDVIIVWSFDRKTYAWSSPKSSHSWNLADFMKSGRFHHEIWQISPWNLWNLWNPADFTMKSGRLHEIHKICEIQQISPWNPVDFMKSGGFQVKSTPNLIKSDVWAKTLLMFQQKLFWFYKVWVDFTWNPTDFMWISCEIERPLARNCNPMFIYSWFSWF